MTVEYILLLVAVFFIGLKMTEAPRDAFKKSGPILATRIEKQLITGDGFRPNGERNNWDPEP